jgi:ribosomal protein S18 acetylase RimI-like enzyme
MRGNAMNIEIAGPEDAGAVLKLQKSAYWGEAQLYNDYDLPPLTQTLDEMRKDLEKQLVLKYVMEGEIVGSVRAFMREGTCYIGRLVVRPDLQDQGIGTRLLSEIEGRFTKAKRYELFTGHRSEKPLHMYEKRGYRIFKSEPLHENLTLVYLERISPAD